MIKVLEQIPKVLFGRNSLKQIGNLVSELELGEGYILYLIDNVHKKTGVLEALPLKNEDYYLLINTDNEPTTEFVDALRDDIKNRTFTPPKLIVGIGGGSALDIAKAVSILLTNPGSSVNYQGWNLVRNAPIPKIGVPTLSGTGSEATKTAVLTSPVKKQGINSKYSMFDAVLLDPLLTRTVPEDQRFYTGMDCYIHSVESIKGSFINNIIRVYVKDALEKCKEVFLKKEHTDEDREKLMIASYFGGLSIANSEVGVCHALSYGISHELKYHHGIANCIVFNQLDEFYSKEVKEFRKMIEVNNIVLPQKVTKALSEDNINRMIDMTFRMENPLTNALGENWRNILTREKVIELYEKM